MKPKHFWLTLILIAITGLAIRSWVGSQTLISFDEWQHLFIASGARWADLAFELRTNAHPPLFFALLGMILKLGNTALYRLIPIAAGVGSIVMVGLIARRIFRSPATQLACAAVFALSIDAVSISVEIRSYQLAVFLVLVAFRAWLSIFSGADGVREGIVFAVCSSLAMLSHYSAVFFLTACLLTAPLLFRNAKKRVWSVIALAFPCVVFAVEYAVHVGTQSMQGYLSDFYLGMIPGETPVGFLLRNSLNFFNLFSPIAIHNKSLFLLVGAIVCAAVAWVLIRRFRTLPGAAILIAGIIVLELVATSLLDKYPFGGMLRHQYIAAPFLLIAVFTVLDTAIAPLPVSLQYVTPLLLLAASTANLIAYGPKLIEFPGEVVLAEEFNAWRSAFPHAKAVYVDHWSVIAHFIHTSDQPRTFVSHIPDAASIDEYRTSDGTLIFYDKTRFILDLKDPSLYQSLAACLRNTRVGELTLFFYSPGDKRIPQPDRLKRIVAEQAASHGLALTGIDIGATYAVAGFRPM